MNGQKVLITGGAGFIGSHLTDFLLSQGCRVRIVDDFSSGMFDNIKHVVDQVELVVGDIRDRETIRKAVQGVDLVCHLAALVSVPLSIERPSDSFSINVIGTQNILDEANKAKVRRVIIASSAAVYGRNENIPLHESESPLPQSPYGIHKLQCEQLGKMYAMIYQLPVTVLRFFNVYGPRQDPSSPYSGVISLFVRNILCGKTVVIHGDGKQTRDFIYVRDVVRSIYLSLKESGKDFQLFNVGSGKQTKINRLFQMLVDIVGKEVSPPVYEMPRQGDIRHSLADISRIRESLTFEPDYSIERGLREMLQFNQK